MIELHRLGQDEPFHLNPDLIETLEATPDTVVSLATGHKVVVAEGTDEVIDSIRGWRVSIAAGALERRPARRR